MSALDLTPLPKTPSPRILTPTRLLVVPDPRIGHTRVEDESDIEKIYVLGDILGKGGFGVVLEVTHKATGVKYAMKIVNKDKPGSGSTQLLEREVAVLKRVNHPNIIKLEEVFETSKKMFMVMELCKGGALSTELKKRHFFRENDAKMVMKKIVEAVVYMHDCDMVHRDLKLDNVLLSTADPDNEFNLRVTDFGLCYVKGLPGCEIDVMDNKCGTLLYMAPEVILNRHDYTKMCDVWSLGVIMYCLLCGRYPYKSNNLAKLEEMIFSGKFNFCGMEWDNVSDDAKALISNMMCIATTDRFTARRILDDSWFTGKTSKGFLNAMDLMRDMANEQAIMRKVDQDAVEPENTDIEKETDIVISSPSGLMEPSGMFPITATPECLLNTGTPYANKFTPLNLPPIHSRLRTSRSAQSTSQKRTVTQASPSRKMGEQTYSNSSNLPTKFVQKTFTVDPSSSGLISTQKRSQYSTRSTFTASRGLLVGFKGTLPPPSSCSGHSRLSPSRRPSTTCIGGDYRERRRSLTRTLHSPIRSSSNEAYLTGNNSHVNDTERLDVSPTTNLHSPRSPVSSRNSSTISPPTNLNSQCNVGERISVSPPTTSLLFTSPSSSPGTSPSHRPRASRSSSPRASPCPINKSLLAREPGKKKKFTSPVQSPHLKLKKVTSGRRASSPNIENSPPFRQ